jgi:hypothetical protein
MWALINKRAMLRQQGKLPQQALHLIGQQITAGLKGDRRQRAADVAEAIDKHLAGRETKEAWRCLKGWYKTASKSAPAASPMSLAAQTAKCVVLYGRVFLPQGSPTPSTLTKPTFRMDPLETGNCGQLFGDFKTDVLWGCLGCRQSTSKCGSAMPYARRRKMVT